ncbi:hypothetical protein MLD38_019337 [Melastoma candidum]|uniref:Uncharacterized protein n=1 Tax=Melastoma candidum TaxID=119954 RepID=A0ACB9QXT8_9MYRT|nr:hypothetical protein MLD38_019337 [Melastoma candidum]
MKTSYRLHYSVFRDCTENVLVAKNHLKSISFVVELSILIQEQGNNGVNVGDLPSSPIVQTRARPLLKVVES